MRHRVAGRHLNRTASHRLALCKNLVKDLIRNERIRTTEAKAKEAKGLVDKIITYGKHGSLNDRRMALAFVNDKDIVDKVFTELNERYAERSGGYTRVLKLGQRQGDGAKMAILELVK